MLFQGSLVEIFSNTPAQIYFILPAVLLFVIFTMVFLVKVLPPKPYFLSIGHANTKSMTRVPFPSHANPGSPCKGQEPPSLYHRDQCNTPPNRNLLNSAEDLLSQRRNILVLDKKRIQKKISKTPSSFNFLLYVTLFTVLLLLHTYLLEIQLVHL